MKDKFLAQIKLPGGETVNAPEGVPTAPSGNGTLEGITSWVIIALTTLGVIAALIFLIWGAISWITSGGDVEKLQSAKRKVTYSIIGLVVILLSVIILQLVGSILGTN